MKLSYTGKGGSGGGLKLLAGPTKPAGYKEEDRLKATPSPPGWGPTTTPRQQQLVTETAATKFAP